jgi:hypothetical protein
MKRETINTDTEETHGFVNETDKQHYSNPKELREDKAIPQTPFVARKYDDKWIITVGRYRIMSQFTFNTFEECQEAVRTPNWNEVVTLIGAIAETMILEKIEELKPKGNRKTRRKI